MDTVSGLNEVDFEIALTALLATTVASFPVGTITEYHIVKVLAVGLLVLTLIRRLALINQIEQDSRLLEVTTQLLDLFTYISVMYLFYNFSVRFASIEQIPVAASTIFTLVAPSFAMGFLLVQEVVLKDALEGSVELFTAKSDARRGTVFGAFLSVLAVFVGNRRHRFHKDTRQTNLVEFVDQDASKRTDEQVAQMRVSVLNFLLGAVLLPLLFLSVLVATGSWLLGISMVTALLLLFVLFTVAGLVDIWYSIYGVLGAGDRNGYLHAIVLTVTYFFVGHMVYSV